MNSQVWSWFSSLGEGDAIAGTTPVGADRVGIGAAFAGVAAWVGAARQDGTVGAGREFTDLADPATDLASTDQAATGLASTGRAAIDPASTDQAQIVLETDRAGIVLETDQAGTAPGRQPSRQSRRQPEFLNSRYAKRRWLHASTPEVHTRSSTSSIPVSTRLVENRQ
jgi:hypothetical protein